MKLKYSIFFIFSCVVLLASATVAQANDRLLFLNGATVTDINFPPVLVGDQKEISVKIHNSTDKKSDEITGFKIVPEDQKDFSVVTYPDVVGPKETLDVVVRFKPLSPGQNKSVRITLYYGDDSLVINATGEAKLPPTADFILFETPDPLDFTAFSKPLHPGDTAFQIFKIKNRGGEGGTIISMEFTTKNTGFSVVDFKPNTPVAANSFKTFTIRFIAQNPGVDKVNTLRITTSTGLLTLEVRAEVEAPPEAKLRILADNPLDLHVIRPGDTAKPEAIWIENTGNKPEEIRTIRFPEGSEFFLVVPLPPQIILGPNGSPNDQFRFRISFTAKTPGMYLDTLNIITAGNETLRLRVMARVEPERLQVFPKALAFDSVLVNTTATRSLRLYNPNKIPVEVTFAPINNARFTRSEPTGNKAVIPAQEDIEVKIAFTPVNTMAENGGFRFSAFNDMYPPVPLSGKGYELPQGKLTVTVLPDELDFKEIFIDSASTLEVGIVNSNAKLLKARDFESFNPQFSVSNLNASQELELQPNSTTPLRITFQPKDTLSQPGKIEFKVGDFTYSVFVKGKGKVRAPENKSYSTRLMLENMTVAVGDTFSLAVLLKENSLVIAAGSQYDFEIEFAFTPTVLYPLATEVSEITGSERFLKQKGTYSASAGEELLKAKFIAALGDMPVAQVRVVSFTWLDDAGKPVTTTMQADTAEISITGTEGRLVNANKGGLTLSVSPNPGIGDIQCEFSNYELGATLKIYNTEGLLVRDLSDQITSVKKPFVVTFPTAEIPGGVYFCRLTSGKNSIVRTIFIQK